MSIIRPKRHTFFLTVEEHFPMNSKEAINHVHAWFESHGHTSVEYGFDLCWVANSGDRSKKIERKSSVS